MTRLIIHAGYPKAMSTTLQRGFMAQHEEINYLGIGFGGGIDYVNRDVEFIFEILLKYARRDVFEEKQTWAKECLDSVVTDEKVNVVSSEHLSMNFSLQGIDPDEKIQRLSELTKQFETKIVLISRDKGRLLKSLYSEFVRMGYDQSIDDFYRWAEALSDRNFMRDLDVDQKILRIKNHFAEVEVVRFEELLTLSVQDLMDRMSAVFEVGRFEDVLPQFNKGLSDDELLRLLSLNRQNRREMGLGMMEPFERHRNRTLLERYFNEKDVFANVLKKRSALRAIEMDKGGV